MKRIAFLTDIHLGEQFPEDNNVNPQENFKRIIEDLSNRNINEIIFGGDIGDANSHNYFFDSLKDFSINLILGNHDKYLKVQKHLSKQSNRNELYYNTEDKYYKYLFLDTSSEELSNNQIEWLQQELKTEKQVIIFIHHPIIEIETPVDKLYPLKNRELIKSILIKSKKTITIFCGHYHMNDERIYQNIRQIVTQALSYQIIKNTNNLEIDNLNFGYRIIEIKSENIATELINFN